LHRRITRKLTIKKKTLLFQIALETLELWIGRQGIDALVKNRRATGQQGKSNGFLEKGVTEFG
jgi:hypothetical protein